MTTTRAAISAPESEREVRGSISVAISTYERPDQLDTCLRTILEGTTLPGEIIVVDQSRDDRTRLLVEALDSDIVRCVDLSPPSISAARNRAFELARSEYVAILDDDCEMPPQWLQEANAELRRHRFPDALFGEIRDPIRDPSRKSVPVSMHIAQPKEWVYPANPWQVGFGGHSIIRRDTFLTLGGLDRRLGYGAELLSAEDIDFNYRLLKQGYRVVSTPAFWVFHRPPSRPPRLFFDRNFGFAAFCAKHIRQGDRRPWRMFAAAVLSDAKMLASALRRGSWIKARTWFWMTAGTWSGLVRGLRSYS